MNRPPLTHDPYDREPPRWEAGRRDLEVNVTLLTVAAVFVAAVIEWGAEGAAWACVGLGTGALLAWLGFQWRTR